MMSLEPIYIGGYDKGLIKNKKPRLVMDNAFSDLRNAYVYRDWVQKRQGLEIVGRLSRLFTSQLLSTTISSPGSGTVTYNIFTGLNVLASQPNAELVPGNISPITIVLGAPGSETLTDTTGTGIMTVVPGINISSAYLNYNTGILTITTTGAFAASSVTVTLSYYPSLPVMGILTRELKEINQEETVFFDTIYAYRFSGGSFQEYSNPSVTWNGNDSDFFWGANYRGSTPDSRAFFVTNFNNGQNGEAAPDPIRYTLDGVTWNTLAPLVDATHTLYQARIIIPYYGRLVMLNVWEGLTASGQTGAVNIFNRCRFSQIGDPTAADAWISDQFGKGGFLDAPTNEAIVSAIFYKNTLIVGFERSTWQLRYVGEYGLPFIWERISSDFGTESTFSTVLFDDGVLAIGDKAIINSNGVNVKRLDIEIPDLVFLFKNALQGTARIQSARDFRRELVFWNYVDSSETQVNQQFPNRVLLYNYRNNTWAIFRDNVTAFGTLQPSTAITWDSLDIFWDDEDTTWDDPDEQSEFPYIVSGNQEGFIHRYGYKTPDDGSLSITGVNLSTSPIQLTIANHNLEDGEIIFISGLQFLDSTGTTILPTDINNQTYQVEFIDNNTIGILKWNPVSQEYEKNFSFTPVSSAIYVGGATAALDPVLYVQTKDFNPYEQRGMQMKMSYIDFLTDATPSSAMSVQLWLNSSMSVQGNVIVGNQEVETYLPTPYYVPNSEYTWHRFFATANGQYIRVVMTYDDDLMNDLDTRNETWALNAMRLWVRQGGRNVF